MVMVVNYNNNNESATYSYHLKTTCLIGGGGETDLLISLSLHN